MHHVADVALVDAHAESDGGDNAVGLPGHEAALNAFTLIMRQTCVVSLGLDSIALKVLGDVLGGLLQRHVDNARLPWAFGHPFDQTPALVLTAYRLDQQVEVGPIETGGDHIVRSNGEFGLHVGDDFRRGCGG